MLTTKNRLPHLQNDLSYGEIRNFAKFNKKQGLKLAFYP